MRFKLFLAALAGLVFSFSNCKNSDSSLGAKTGAKASADSSKGTVTGNPELVKRHENPWKGKVSELFTDADFQKVFNEDPSKSLNKNALENYCLWTWLRPDWIERDNANDKTSKEFKSPKFMMTLKLRDFGNRYVAEQTMGEIVDKRLQVWNDRIDAGQGAVWAAEQQMLSVRAGQFIFDVEMNAADSPAENLEKAKKVAAIVAPKLIGSN